MNTITYIILIYLFFNFLAILLIPAPKNQLREFIKSIRQNYRRIDLDIRTSPSMRIIKKIQLTLLLGIFFCLVFTLILPLLPLLIKTDKKRILHDKEENANKGSIQIVADKTIIEGFVRQISPIKHSVDSNNIYIVIALVIYSEPQTIYTIVCWNDLAKEVEKSINKQCKIRAEGKFTTIKNKNRNGEENQSEIFQAESVQLLQTESCLMFHDVSGKGTVQCFDCKYEEDIIFFTHGDYNATIGYQCQMCGKFHKIRSISEEYHMINIVDSLICDCNGVLENEKPLFCPKCKSKRLSCKMQYIT